MEKQSRIKINGEWYIKEEKEVIDMEINYYKGCQFENAEMVLDFTLIDNDDGTFISPTIEYKDKRNPKKDKEFWDSDVWFLDVKNRMFSEYHDLDLSESGFRILESFIDELYSKEYLKEAN